MTGRHSTPLRIAPWLIDTRNPYQHLFYGALAGHGVVQVPGLEISDRSLKEHRADIDAVHLHWPEYVWRIGVKSNWARARRIAGLATFLSLSRRLGVPTIWTAHNLRPHEGHWMDGFGMSAVGRASDLIIAHSPRTADELRRRFQARIVVMHQGNYDGIYPAPQDRDMVLKALGLSPDRPTVTMIGALRPYKGLERAIAAVGRLSGEVQLVIAGEPDGSVDLAGLMLLAQETKWLAVVPRSTSEQEFSDIVHASDAVLLPYSRVTTSAVMLAAWSCSRGVITSRQEYFEDLLNNHPQAGRSVDVASVDQFAAAILDYLTIPAPARFAEARRAADCYAWPKCIEPVAEALRELRRA